MSKLTLTAIGGAGVAAAVPMMHFGERKMVKASAMALFLAGWVLVSGGLSMPSPGTKDEVSSKWKTRQLVLSVTGVVMVVMGVGLVRSRKLPLPAGAAMFVSGWALVTGAVVLSDADYEQMSPIEKSDRIVRSLVATLTIISGAALISMSDSGVTTRGVSTVPLNNTTLQVAGAGTFALGWMGLVATSAMQD